MWLRSSSIIVPDKIFQIATPVSYHILACAEKNALFDVTLTCFSYELLERCVKQLESKAGENKNLDYIFLTHSHFDHVAGLRVFFDKFPNLQVFSSKDTCKILSDKDYQKEVYKFDEESLGALESLSVMLPEIRKFVAWSNPFKSIQTLDEGEVLELGSDTKVKLLSCEGHTDDSSAFYLTPENCLVAGDGLGFFRGRGQLAPSFASSYYDYIESLEKFSALPVRFFAQSHSGLLVGGQIKQYFSEAISETKRFGDSIKKRLSYGESKEEIIESICSVWKYEHISPDGPFIVSQEKLIKGMIEAIIDDI